MKCPECRRSPPNFTGKIREQSQLDAELDQQRRIRWCLYCSYEWETVEIDQAELVRLRRLAHQAVMGTVKPKTDFRPWRHEA